MDKFSNIHDVMSFSNAEKLILSTGKNKLLSISDFVKKTKLPRTTVVDNLVSLEKRRLLTKHPAGRRYVYEVKDISQVFESVLGKGGDFVKTNHGIESLMKTWQAISMNPLLTKVCLLQPVWSVFLSVKKVPSGFLEKIHKEHLKKNIIFDAIVSEGQYSELKNSISDKAFSSMKGRPAEVTIIPKSLFSDISVEMVILPKVVYLNDWKKEISIEIRYEPAIAFLHVMFDLIKLTGKRVDHNRTMDKYLSVDPEKSA